MSNKQKFIDIVQKEIKREGIMQLMEYLERSDFFVAPASTQYHGSYPGGLVDHCLNVYEQLKTEVATLGKYYEADISEESIAIVALFHDLCKVNCYETYTRNVKNEVTKQWEQVECYRRNPVLPMGHGDKSMFILMKFMDITTDEALAIKWHMSAFDISPYSTLNELSKAYEMSMLAFLLHIADMKATYILENRGE